MCALCVGGKAREWMQSVCAKAFEGGQQSTHHIVGVQNSELDALDPSHGSRGVGEAVHGCSMQQATWADMSSGELLIWLVRWGDSSRREQQGASP